MFFEHDPRPFMEAAATVDPSVPDVFLMTEVKTYIESRKRRIGDITFHPVVSAHAGHAYIVTRAAAANLLKNYHPMKMVNDEWKYFILCGYVKVWVCKEAHAVQKPPGVPLRA